MKRTALASIFALAAGLLASFAASSKHSISYAVTPTPTSLSRGGRVFFSMQYPSGWNIVAGNALHLDIAGYGMPGAIDSSVYGLSADGSSYIPVTSDADIVDSQGYWGHFVQPSNAILSMHTGQVTTIALPAGLWTLVGNPSYTAVTVSGADAVEIYVPDSGYEFVSALAPGQGAWAYSASGGTMTITPEPSTP